MTSVHRPSSNTWLRNERSALAAEQIVDAAASLFAERGVAAVGMAEIASAAGCSRATVYRYFDNRDALHNAFVHREARRVGAAVAHELADVADPRERLVRAVMSSIRLVRDDPILAAWFSVDDAGTAVRLAQSSEVIEAMVAELLGPGAGTDPDIRRRASWVVRVIVSLLADPGSDADEERALVEEFVVPVVVG